MINSWTWLIFSILTFSVLALDGIYFPNMSVEISILIFSILALDGYCHTCVFLCKSRTWIFTNLKYSESDNHLPFATPSLGFQQRMQDCPNHKQVFTHLFIKDLWFMAIYNIMGAHECGRHFSFRKVIMCDKSHILFTKMWLYNPCTQKCQIKYLAQLYLQLIRGKRVLWNSFEVHFNKQMLAKVSIFSLEILLA